MKHTLVLRIDPLNPDPGTIQIAADALRRGGLVAFPTETVYGLGALALDVQCVERIFEAKGRPSTNPLIVHVAGVAAAREISACWPPMAEQLARVFWPGPLTLVVRKSTLIPSIVTAGGATVGIRQPAHPVALALLNAVGAPIAAPSANPANRLSPTAAEHVLAGLDGRIDLVLDAGPTSAGIESTVVDVSAEPIALLRPGPVSRRQVEDCLQRPIGLPADLRSTSTLRSPGQMARHYQPSTPLALAPSASELVEVVKLLQGNGAKIGVLARSIVELELGDNSLIAMPESPAAYATVLYAVLHRMDLMGLDWIVVEAPPPGVEWAAVADRLRRADRGVGNNFNAGVRTVARHSVADDMPSRKAGP